MIAPSLLEAAERDARADQCRAAPDELRAQLALGLSEIDGALATRMERIDHPQFNRVVGLGVSAAARRRVVEQLVAAYRAAGSKRFAVELAPEAGPPELREWLGALGLQAVAGAAKLWRDGSPQLDVLCPLRLTLVEPRDAQALGRVLAAGAGLPSALAPWSAALVGRAGWRAYLAWDAGEPVAGALMRIDGGVAWLGGDATLPSHRKRGAQAASIARRVADAVAAGAHTLVAETDPESDAYRHYLHAGFKLAYLRESFRQTASK